MELIERPLTDAESNRLIELERTIKDNFLGFVAVGNALAEIRDKRLYRDENGRTFEGYCAELWDICRRRAYQLIDAAQAVENVNNCTQNNAQLSEIIIPQNEAQARELAKLPPEEQPIVWNKVVKKVKDGHPLTARLTKSEVRVHLGENLHRQVKKSNRSIKAAAKNRQSDAFFDAWERLWQQIEIEQQKNWRDTSRKVVLSNLVKLMEMLEK